MWSQTKDRRGFIVCGFPATFAHPELEASLAFPSGSPEFVDDFLKARSDNLEYLFKKIAHMATEASAPTPSAQAFNCMLRSCTSQTMATY